MGIYRKIVAGGAREWGHKLTGTVKEDKELSEISPNDNGFGSGLMTKTLYEGKYSTVADYDWVECPPKQMSKRASRAHDRVAIKIYKIRDQGSPAISGHRALKPHRIDIQNPLLVATLEPILKEEEHYLDVNDTATFIEPFRPLFFCYGTILKKV